MRRIVWIVIALLAFGYSLWPGMPAFAAYGAIAWDRGSGKYGVSWNQPTRKRAKEVALGECGSTGCNDVEGRSGNVRRFSKTDNGKQAGAAWRKDRETARLAALQNCAKAKAGDCVIRASDCNK